MSAATGGSGFRRVPRSVGAVLAGLAVTVGLSIGTDALLYSTGVFPPLGTPMATTLWLLATGYRVVFAVLGCYLAARLAPSAPMTHALALGGIGFLASVVGAVAAWGKGPEFGPLWYPLALVATALPCAWLGGRLFVGSGGTGDGA